MNKGLETKILMDVSISVEKFLEFFNGRYFDGGDVSRFTSLTYLNSEIVRVVTKYKDRAKESYVIMIFDNVISTYDYMTRYMVGILGCASKMPYLDMLSKYILGAYDINKITDVLLAGIFRDTKHNSNLELSLFMRRLIEKYTSIYEKREVDRNIFYNRLFRDLLDGKTEEEYKEILDIVTEVLELKNNDVTLISTTIIKDSIPNLDVNVLALEHAGIEDSDTNEDAIAKLSGMLALIDQTTSKLTGNMLSIITQILILYSDSVECRGIEEVRTSIRKILSLIFLRVIYINQEM